MKIFDDIWDSLKGNAKSRINEPIFGAFLFAWCLCNWDKLTVLFFGNLKLEERITTISKQFDFIETPRLIVTNPDILVFPLLITGFYLYCLPHLSHWLKTKLHPIEIKQHDQVVELDIAKANKQLALNKARLLSNPDKDFLVQKVQQDIDYGKEKVEQIKQRNIIFKEKVELAKQRATQAKAELEIINIDLKKKQRKEDSDRFKFDQSAALHRTTMASNRFPCAYFFLHELSNALREDDVVLSLDGLSACVAAIFGYESYAKLLEDKNFCNDQISNLSYVYYDDEILSALLENIVEEENSTNEDLESGLLFDHINGIMESLSYDFIDAENLSTRICELLNDDSYDLLNGEGTSGTIVESNTIYDEGVENIEVVSSEFDGEFIVELTATASGSHYKEDGVPGITMNLDITVKCPVIIGLYGLGPYEISEINSSLEY